MTDTALASVSPISVKKLSCYIAACEKDILDSYCLHSLYECKPTLPCPAIQVSIDVPEGECVELEISTVPYFKEGIVDYTIPMTGAISFWTERKIHIPPVEGWHFNYNLPIDDIIEVAEVRFRSLCPQCEIKWEFKDLKGFTASFSGSSLGCTWA